MLISDKHHEMSLSYLLLKGINIYQDPYECKVLMHVYNCVNGSSPIYLQDLLSFYNSVRQGLRAL